MRKVIAKASQQVLELHWTDGDVFVHGNVDASTDEEIKRIVARGLASDYAANTTLSVKISVKIAMCSAEHSFNEWLEMRSTEFYDGTYVVGEQIALSRYRTRTIAVRRGNSEVVRIAAVAFKLRLDSDVLVEVESPTAATAV